MPQYTEPQMFENLSRLARFYFESFPDDKEQVERFLRWAHSQYGYTYGRS